MLAKAKELTEKKFRNLLLNLQEAYENGEPEVTDDEFDLLTSLYEGRFDKKFSEVGFKQKGVEIELPYKMLSQNKAKGENAERVLNKFKEENEGPYIIADKLDGNSAMYIVRHKGKKIIQHLYTRGDGTIGTDISKIIPYLNLPVAEDIIVRGEIVFPKKAFSKYVRKQKKLGNPRKLNNSRNVANGIILAKTLDKKAAKKLHFVPFNILSENDLTQEEQYAKLEEYGFISPWCCYTDNFNIKKLTKMLEKRREESPYDIDGLVLTDNRKHYDFPEDKNPEHQIAFKVDTLVTTTVLSVEWRASKDGFLKPIAILEPVVILGNDISRAYVHNAHFVVSEKIGKGATVLTSKGGDIIPTILSVLEPAKKPGLPPYNKSEYSWNETEVDFVLKDPNNNPEVQMARTKYFAKTMGIERLGPGVINNLYNAGIQDISDLIEADVDTLASAEKMGPKSAKTLHDNIHIKITNAPLATVMVASGVFGFGFALTRMNLIVDACPDIMDYADAEEGTVSEMISAIGGFNKLADVFEEKLPVFKKWLKKHPQITIAKHKPKKKISKKEAKSLPLYKQVIVFTGFTDASLNTQIEALGGEVLSRFTLQATIVVAKDASKMTAKMKKAEEKGLKIYSLKDFVKKYNLKTTKL